MLRENGDEAKAGQVDRALRLAAEPHRGPVFLDIALEALFSQADAELPDLDPPPARQPDPDALAGVARLLGEAERPVLVLGSDVWADWAEDAIVGREIVEARGGRVARIAVEPGHSTTSIIARIQSR